MTDDALQRLERRAQRERVARKRAEALLEARSRELFVTNEALMRLTASLEQQVAVRTRELESKIAELDVLTQNLEGKNNLLHVIRVGQNNSWRSINALCEKVEND